MISIGFKGPSQVLLWIISAPVFLAFIVILFLTHHCVISLAKHFILLTASSVVLCHFDINCTHCTFNSYTANFLWSMASIENPFPVL